MKVRTINENTVLNEFNRMTNMNSSHIRVSECLRDTGADDIISVLTLYRY